MGASPVLGAGTNLRSGIQCSGPGQDQCPGQVARLDPRAALDPLTVLSLEQSSSKLEVLNRFESLLIGGGFVQVLSVCLSSSYKIHGRVSQVWPANALPLCPRVYC